MADTIKKQNSYKRIAEFDNYLILKNWKWTCYRKSFPRKNDP